MKEIHSLIINRELDKINVKKLSELLNELHSIIDSKSRCIKNIHSIFYKQYKEFVVRNSDHSDSWIRVVNNSSEDYSETESVNGEIVPGKSKFNEFSFNQINLFSTNQFDPINCCSNSCSTSALKKQIVTKHSDDSLNNVPLTCGTVETGPFLRKKLNFNMKSNKHKTKKYISSSSEIQQSLV